MRYLPAAVIPVSLLVASCGGGSRGTSITDSSPRPMVDASPSNADLGISADAPSTGDAATPEVVALLPDTSQPPDAGTAGNTDSNAGTLLVPDTGAQRDTFPSATPDASDAAGLGLDLASATPDVSTDAIVVSPSDGPAGNPDATTGSTLPYLVESADAGGSGQLLTCIAHLYGQTIGGVPLHPIKGAVVANPGASPADVIVTGQLQSYSDPSSVGLHVPANSTATTPPIDLTFHFDALYAISAPLTANLTLQLTAAGESPLLDVHSRNITILPKNTIFWKLPDASGTSSDSRFLIGTFVTPHDKKGAIDQLLKEAVSHSRFGAMLGYQYATEIGKTMDLTISAVPPGSCSTTTLALRAGPLSLSAQASCTACTSANASLQIYTQAAWSASGAPVAIIDSLGSRNGTFSVPSDDTYVFAGCNPSSNFTNRDLKVSLGFTAATGAFDQMAAIFLALKARGMQYVSVSQDFFGNSSQNVKFPSESLATASANCIDGTLVFASALESMGMRPSVVTIPGHAFVAVLADPSSDPCQVGNWLPIETTMVATDTPMAAVNEDQKNKMPMVVQVVATQCPTFTQNAPTIWDVKSLREIGVLPAPL